MLICGFHTFVFTITHGFFHAYHSDYDINVGLSDTCVGKHMCPFCDRFKFLDLCRMLI